MSIQIGDKIPNVNLKIMGENGPEDLNLVDFSAGKTMVLFAVPGAYTPTCSAAHVPGFVVNADKIKAKGVDAIACVSVNDVFVMSAWGSVQNADGQVLMLADGSAEFTTAADLTLDLTAAGLGIRSQRYSMIIKDGTVASLHIDEAGKFEVSDADTILAEL
jgi:peroxiredoxin